MTAHSTGWTTSTRSRPSPLRTTSSSDQSMCGASAAAHSAIRAANTGEDSSSSTAMPAHCAPCPGNTNTVLAARPAVEAVVTAVDGAPSTREVRAVSKASRSAATTAARWLKAVRVSASE